MSDQPPLRHRPGCDQPGWTTHRVAEWIVIRCTRCRATATHRRTEGAE